MAGLITWHELITSNVEAATSFYTQLLGLELEMVDMGDFEYPMLQKDGRSHAGFVARPEEAEAPSHWYPYVQVDDVDAGTEQAKNLGSPVYMGPADVSETLRFVVLGDPQGATFGLMSWDQEPPTGVFAWDELHAADTGAAKTFYTELVGWTASSPMENYEIFSAGETQVAGLYGEEGGRGAHWLAYFAVDEVDAVAAKADELGGATAVPPSDIPGVGRFSVFTDPTGAVAGLYKPNN